MFFKNFVVRKLLMQTVKHHEQPHERRIPLKVKLINPTTYSVKPLIDLPKDRARAEEVIRENVEKFLNLTIDAQRKRIEERLHLLVATGDRIEVATQEKRFEEADVLKLRLRKTYRNLMEEIRKLEKACLILSLETGLLIRPILDSKSKRGRLYLSFHVEGSILEYVKMNYLNSDFDVYLVGNEKEANGSNKSRTLALYDTIFFLKNAYTELKLTSLRAEDDDKKLFKERFEAYFLRCKHEINWLEKKALINRHDISELAITGIVMSRMLLNHGIKAPIYVFGEKENSRLTTIFPSIYHSPYLGDSLEVPGTAFDLYTGYLSALVDGPLPEVALAGMLTDSRIVDTSLLPMNQMHRYVSISIKENLNKIWRELTNYPKSEAVLKVLTSIIGYSEENPFFWGKNIGVSDFYKKHHPRTVFELEKEIRHIVHFKLSRDVEKQFGITSYF